MAPLRERCPYHFIDLETFSVTRITFRRDLSQLPRGLCDLSHLKRHFRSVSRAPAELGVELWLCSLGGAGLPASPARLK